MPRSLALAIVLSAVSLACFKAGGDDEVGSDTGSETADTTTDESSCPIASEGCPCSDGGACDPGLMCMGGTCVPADPTEGTTEDTTTETSEDTTETTEGDTFTCSDGTTVPAEYACDAVADCPDNSDEVTGCGIPAFTCGDGLEVPADWVCDTFADCVDGSDEANCDCPPDPGDNVCTACTKMNCCDEITACYANQQCACLADCLQEGGDPFGCSQVCGVMSFPPELQALGGCTMANCSMQCT